jgi:hypothetical protein
MRALDSLQAVSSFPRNAKPGLALQQQANARAEQSMVVHQQNTQFF